MSCRHRHRLLFSSAVVRVADFVCDEDHTGFGPEESCSADEFAFARRGVYEREVEGVRSWIDVDRVVFYRRGEVHRVRHPVPGGDACTLIRLRSDLLVDLATRFDPGAPERPERLFKWRDARTGGASMALLRALLDHLREGDDALALEEHILALLTAVAADAAGAVPEAPRPAHCEVVAAARLVLAVRYADPTTIADIAGLVGCSPCHLSRVFPRVTGMRLHAHRDRLRLRAALEALAAGAGDLTALALDLGYASHSHFTSRFTTHFGVPPSCLRRGAARRHLARLRKNLKARIRSAPASWGDA